MTRVTQQTILFVAMSCFSAGIIGFLIYKLGLLDIVLYFVIQVALLFPVFAVILGVLSPDVYNGMHEKLNNTIALINRSAASAVAKGKSLGSVDVDLSRADTQA